MKSRVTVLAVLIIFIAALAPVSAEQRFGVKVYADATYDGDTSQWVSTNMKVDAACYRTDADPIDVNQFYKKMFGVTEVQTTNHTGLFKKGDINITVQSPWTDMKTGRQHKDTLISIVKTK
jgi:hypothetical protein